MRSCWRPSLGLVSYDLMLVADRSSYLATMPLFVLAAGGLARWVVVSPMAKGSSPGIVAAGLGLIVVLSAMSRAQCRTWRDSETLVAHALRVGSGRDGLLVSNFGLDLIASGRDAAGMAQLRKAIQIDPADPDAQENLGIALAERGDTAGAIVQLAEAVRLAPDRSDFRYHLGLALSGTGGSKTPPKHSPRPSVSVRTGASPTFPSARCSPRSKSRRGGRSVHRGTPPRTGPPRGPPRAGRTPRD